MLSAFFGLYAISAMLVCYALGHWERNTHLTFTIEIDLDRPGELLLEDEPFPNEDAALAAVIEL